MLVEFRLRNYRCFKDEQVLSLVASADSSLPENLITEVPNLNGNLLRSVAIYGPNASGKTTILDALHTVQNLVRTSARGMPEDELPMEPFLLDPVTRDAPSAFELTFIHEGVRYQYGFEADSQRIHREYLYSAPAGRTAFLFEREADHYRFGSLFRGPRKQLAEATRQNALFLSMAANANHPTLSVPYAWFARTLHGVQAQRVANAPVLRIDESLHERIRALLKIADLGIDDYRIDPMPSAQKRLELWFVPPSSDSELRKVDKVSILMTHTVEGQETVDIPLHSESQGTFQLFALSTGLLGALLGGEVLYVDEIDASLHPTLVRSILLLFSHPQINDKGAQLIFNTHDTTLMDNDLFRRDQIWFTEKDAEGAAHLYSLLEFSPRKDASLAKGYLQGRYGALPIVGSPEMLLRQEEG